VGARVQAVAAGDERTWTVLGDDHLVVAPIEEFLEHHRVIGSSPNTVRSYAKALELWWAFLGYEGAGWEDPGIGVLRSFVTWLRTGLTPGVTPIGRAVSEMGAHALAGDGRGAAGGGRVLLRLSA